MRQVTLPSVKLTKPALVLIFAAFSLLLASCETITPPPPADRCYPDEPALEGATYRDSEAYRQGIERGLPYVPNQILVKYESDVPGLTPQGLSHFERHRLLSLEVRREFGLTLLHSGEGLLPDVLELPAGASVAAAAARLERDPRVEYAEPNYYLRPLSVPDDPFLSEQWNLLEFGVPEAWAIETGGSDIVIAIVDSGVDTSHEDLRNRMLMGCDFYKQDNDPNPGGASGNAGHGTHVAGIAAAVGNNGKGVAGVAFGGTLIVPIKVFDDAGAATDSRTVAQAFRWAAGLPVDGTNPNPNPANIINASLGGPGTNATLDNAVDAARGAGAIVVAASGNTKGGDPSAGVFTPANAPGALAVGSVNEDRQRSTFSMYGDANNRTPDLVMAPGGSGTSQVCSDNGGIVSTYPNNEYACVMGTSMAAPFVSGALALVWSQNPDWTADEVLDQLKSTTYFEAGWDPDEYGAGIVCADRALGAATLCGD